MKQGEGGDKRGAEEGIYLCDLALLLVVLDDGDCLVDECDESLLDGLQVVVGPCTGRPADQQPPLHLSLCTLQQRH